MKSIGRLLLATALALPMAACSDHGDAAPGQVPQTVSASKLSRHADTGTHCHEKKLRRAELLHGKHQPSAPGQSPPAQPAKGESVLDPVYQTCVVRLTDHRNEPPSGFAKSYYSRFQPFNADESRILIFAKDGNWHLYDAETFAHVKQLDLGGDSVEPQWHPSNPEVLYLLPDRGGLSLYAYHVRLEERVKVADLRKVKSVGGDNDSHSIHDVWPRAARAWTRWEGSPSADARYWAFLVETEDEEPLGIITFDLVEQRILGTYDIGGAGKPDHVSMSPKGNFVVASWPKKVADCPFLRSVGTYSKPCGLMAFNRNLTEARGLVRNSSHSDIAIAADGREVIVIANYESGNLEMIDLATSKITPLWRIYIGGASTALHVSGKAYKKPGWVLVSTYWTKDPKNARPWYRNKLMAVELKEEPRILNIANIVSKVRTYFSEPHATVNRGFSKVLFNANWGTGRDEDIDTYLALLPDKAIPSASH